MRLRLAHVCLALLAAAAFACGGPGSSSGGGGGGDASVGVSVHGLSGAGLIVTIDGRAQAIAAGGSVTVNGLTAGRSYPVTVMAQPAGQTCWVDGGGTVAAGGQLVIDCFDAGAGRLRISEVSVCTFASQSCWLELANVGNEPASLARYSLRSSADNKAHVASFTLPDVTVPAGGYVVVRGGGDGDVFGGPGVVIVGDASARPLWSAGGFAELSYGGFVVDYVGLAGALDKDPSDAAAWNGAGVVIGTGAGSAQRDLGQDDRNGAADWTWRKFATPNGRNDVTSDADDDHDGIPDCAEQPGATFAGLDLYGWGARAGTPDIFLEIDWLAGETPGVKPMRAALDKVVAAFAQQGYAMHFDVGALFGSGPADYDMGGGEELPAFDGRLILGDLDAYVGKSSSVDLYALKAAHMDPRRRVVFHYAVSGNTRDSLTGVGEMPGNDLILLLGGAVEQDNAAALQAATIMHELGHNLGLQHGGDVAANFKPNYVSVMNYLYVVGLPDKGQEEADRFDYSHFARTGAACDGGVTSYAELTNPPTDLSRFVIDYSHGTRAAIDEHHVSEAAGLGDGAGGIDFNCDGQIGSDDDLDLNGDGAIGMLTDHDDWGHISLTFQTSYTVDSARLPGFDRSRVADERAPLVR